MADVNDMYSYASLDVVCKYLLWAPHYNVEATRGYLEMVERSYRRGELADWAIEKDGKMIGTAGFASVDLENNSVEIGYVLNPDYWGNGYAREALGTVTRIAFEELGVHRIQLRIMEGNTPSENVALACGYRKEGTLRDLLLVKNEYRTIHFYSLVSSEYFAHN